MSAVTALSPLIVRNTPATYPFTVIDEIVHSDLLCFRWIDALGEEMALIAGERSSTAIGTYLKYLIGMLLEFLIIDSRLTGGTKEIVEGKHYLFHVLERQSAQR